MREVQSRIFDPNDKALSSILQDLDSVVGSRRTPSPGGAPLRMPSIISQNSGAPSAAVPSPIDKDSIYLGRNATQEYTTVDDIRDTSLDQQTPDLNHLYSFLNRQSTDQFSTANKINAQLTDLRSDVSRIVLDVNAALKGQQTEPKIQRVEDQLNSVLSGLAKLDLQQVHAKLDNVLAKSQTAEYDMSNVSRRNRPLPPIIDLTPVVSSIEDLKRVKTRPQPPVDFSPVFDRIDEAEIAQQSHNQLLLQKVEELAAQQPPETPKEPDSLELREMLSNILKHVQVLTKPPPTPMVAPQLPSPPESPAVMVKDEGANVSATASLANIPPNGSLGASSDSHNAPEPGVAQVLAKVRDLGL